MISAQIDELRELALWLDDEFYDVEAAKVRDAADTIWQLRDDLQRANAENAKLREDLDFERSENGYAIEFLDLMAKHCGTKDCPSLVAYVEQLRDENTKLRELVDKLLYGINNELTPADALVWTQEANTMLRELGVDDG